jgi:predicted RNase H-like nuclease (RuvC/YqgF family)
MLYQNRGWSAHTDDQYQFHIILGANIRANEERIKELENYCEQSTDENNQKVKDNKDLKEKLGHERDINQELEDELKRKDEEIAHLKKCVKVEMKLQLISRIFSKKVQMKWSS